VIHSCFAIIYLYANWLSQAKPRHQRRLTVAWGHNPCAVKDDGLLSIRDASGYRPCRLLIKFNILHHNGGLIGFYRNGIVGDAGGGRWRWGEKSEFTGNIYI